MKALCCPKVRLGHRKFSITTSLTLTSSSKIDLPSGCRVSGMIPWLLWRRVMNQLERFH